MKKKTKKKKNRKLNAPPPPDFSSFFIPFFFYKRCITQNMHFSDLTSRGRRRTGARGGSGGRSDPDPDPCGLEPLPQGAGPPEHFVQVGRRRREASGRCRERRGRELAGLFRGVGLGGELLSCGAEAADTFLLLLLLLFFYEFCFQRQLRDDHFVEVEVERERKENPENFPNSRAVLDGGELRELRLGREGRGDGRGDAARGGRGGVCRQRSRSKVFARRFGHRSRSLALSLPPLRLWCRRHCCLGLFGHHALLRKVKKQKRERTPQGREGRCFDPINFRPVFFLLLLLKKKWSSVCK